MIKVQISRDPFARETLYRETYHGMVHSTCWNCGGTRHRAGKPLYSLFAYYTQPDDVRAMPIQHRGFFCSKSCHDAYNS